MANAGVFSYFISPNGYDPATHTQRFSICFEINDSHAVFSEGANADVIKRWKEKVEQFPEQLEAAIRRLEKNTVPLNVYKINHDLLDATTRVISPTFLPRGIPDANMNIPDLWRSFLGFSRASFDNDQFTFQRMPQFVTQQPVIPPVQSIDFASLYAVGQPRTALDRTGNLLTKDADGLSLKEFADYLGGISKEGNPARRRRIDEGISRQDEIFRQQNENRFQQIKTINAPLYNSIVGSFRSFHAQFTQSTSSVTQEERHVTDLVEKHLSNQAVQYLVTNQPVYIKEAINKINEHLCLRQLLGTIVDFSLPWSILSQLLASTEEVSFAFDLDLKEENQAEADVYFGKQVSRFRVAGGGFDPNLIIVLPAGAHANTILKIGQDCKIYDYDAESSSRNVDEALQQRGKGPQEDVKVSLEFAKDYQKTITRLFNSSKESGAITAFTESRASFFNLQQIQSLNKQITNLQTKGQAVFYTRKFDLAPQNTQGHLDDRDLVKGYVILVRKKGSTQWYSLTACGEQFIYPANRKLPDVFVAQELGINIGGIVHCADPVEHNPADVAGSSVTGLTNGFLFLWDGTSVSFRNPMSKQDRRTASPNQQHIEDIKANLERMYDVPVEYNAVHAHHNALFGVDWFPFKKYRRKDAAPGHDQKLPVGPPPLHLKRQYIYAADQVKLKFGDSYEYLAIAQYHNGFVPLLDTVKKYNLNPNTEDVAAFANAQAEWMTLPKDESEKKFLRHDHIKDLIISLDSAIYERGTPNTLRPEHLGESSKDLVIRSSDGPTRASCNRFILPPPVPTLSLYLWYHRKKGQGLSDLSQKNLTESESANWYRKFQSEQFGETDSPAQDSIYSNKLNYLPDPIVTGFVIRFFLDSERTLPASAGIGDQAAYPETYCAFKYGNYPQLSPWSVELLSDRIEDSHQSKVKVDRNAQQLTVYVRQGLKLFCEVIPTFDRYGSQFHPQIALSKDHFIGQDTETGLYYNSLYANISELTFTHASRLPLFEPVIQKIDLYRFHKAETNRKESDLKVVMDLNFEHLNLWSGVPIPGISPTGELELYALWEDFSNSNSSTLKDISHKRNDARADGGFIKIASVKFPSDTHDRPHQPLTIFDSKQSDNSKKYMETIEFFTDNHFNIPYCSDVLLKIRQTSKFASYFPEGKTMDDDTKEFFSRWSDVVELPAREQLHPVSLVATRASEERQLPAVQASSAKLLFNNSKPKVPIVEKIVPIIVEDQLANELLFNGGRVRIYLKTENRMLTGKNERIGIIVSPVGQEESGMYSEVFTAGSYYSKCAADAVMDFPDVKIDNLLRSYHFILDPNLLEKDYIERHVPMYEPQAFSEKGESIGLVTYKPAFDLEQQLWYIEPQLNITERSGQPLHVTWIQLNIVCYNAASARYPVNGSAAAQYERDYRLSNPIRLDFAYLHPPRNCKNPALIFKNRTNEDFTLSCSVNSLFIRNGVLASQFFIHLEKWDGDNWVQFDSRVTKYKVNSLPIGALTSVPVNQDFALLPLDRNYDKQRKQQIEISLSLDYESGWRNRFRAVITEIEYHDSERTLLDLQQILADTSIDVAQVSGVRVINNIVIDY